MTTTLTDNASSEAETAKPATNAIIPFERDISNTVTLNDMIKCRLDQAKATQEKVVQAWEELRKELSELAKSYRIWFEMDSFELQLGVQVFVPDRNLRDGGSWIRQKNFMTFRRYFDGIVFAGFSDKYVELTQVRYLISEQLSKWLFH